MKKRKIKYSAVFFVCWFLLLVLLVDGVDQIFGGIFCMLVFAFSLAG